MVLPEPVGALPQTSRPARASGRVAACTGNGSVMPRSSRRAQRWAGTPRSAKVGGTRGVSCIEGAGTRAHSMGWIGRLPISCRVQRCRPLLLGGSPSHSSTRPASGCRRRVTVPGGWREATIVVLGSAAMEPVMARKMWRTLEPYHGMIYFAPEATAAYEALGVKGFDGYFASRAAPMGAVPAEVVIATFFNFNPEIVRHAIPARVGRRHARPAARGAPRRRRRRAAPRRRRRRSTSPAWRGPPSWPAPRPTAAPPPGRPLYAGHASLPWPEPPHLALWHAISLLREFRGDGHIACLVERRPRRHRRPRLPRRVRGGAPSGPADLPALGRRGVGRRGRATSPAAATSTASGAFTEAGAALRQQIEDQTDALALAPWAALGEAGCDELRSLVRPLSKAIVSGGTFGLPRLTTEV